MTRSRLLHPEHQPVDLKFLLERNRRLLTNPDPSLTPGQRHAHDQFAREYTEQTGMTRDAVAGSAK